MAMALWVLVDQSGFILNRRFKKLIFRRDDLWAKMEKTTKNDLKMAVRRNLNTHLPLI